MKHRYAISLFLLICACSDSNFKGGVATAPAAVPPTANYGDAKDTNLPPTQTTSGDTTDIPGSKPSIDGLQLACANAGANLKVLEQTVSYAERTGCGFGEPGGPIPVQGRIQAEKTSTQNLNLPAGSICEIGIETVQGAQLHYDDMFVFTLNDFMLFANSTFLHDAMLEQDGIAVWDFARVFKSEPKSFGGKSYCIGGTCTIPDTDKTGPVDIKLDSSKIAPIAVALSGQKTMTMNLTAMGDDNEESDCSHTAIDLKVTLKYIP